MKRAEQEGIHSVFRAIEQAVSPKDFADAESKIRSQWPAFDREATLPYDLWLWLGLKREQSNMARPFRHELVTAYPWLTEGEPHKDRAWLTLGSR